MNTCRRCGKIQEQGLKDNGLCNVCWSRMIDGLHRLLDFNPMYSVGFGEPLKYYDDDNVEYGTVLQRQDDERGDGVKGDVCVVGGLEKRIRNIHSEGYRW